MLRSRRNNLGVKYTWDTPLALLHHGFHSLDYPWVSGTDVLNLDTREYVQHGGTNWTHRQVFERTRFLNVGKGGLEVLQFSINFMRSLRCTLHLNWVYLNQYSAYFIKL
jgi:hypothetical protein